MKKLLVSGAALVAAVALLVTLAGLASNGPRDPVLAQQQPSATTLDDLFAQIADSEPGFGGVFFDDDGTLSMYLVDPPQGSAAAVVGTRAEAAVRSALAQEIGERPLRVLPGQYDFRQLKAWHDSMLSLFSIPAVVFTDIDESKNRLAVGVEDVAIAGTVRAELRLLDIPPQAVDIVPTERPVLEDTPVAGTKLLDKVRPLAGGLKIGPARCTLGFIAKDSTGKLGFVTNSHCTTKMFDFPAKPASTPELLARPAISQPKTDKVGKENLDPGLGSCAPKPGNHCRKSDSAFIALNDNVKATLGKIKRPGTDNSTTQAKTNKTSIPPVDAHTVFVAGDFVIVDKSDYSLKGQQVSKVGQRTGWTQGKVTRTCRNDSLTTSDSNSQPYTLRCQFEASYYSAPGDSGSPVFEILDPTLIGSPNQQIRVRLKGIHWGGPPASFSPLKGIEQDLGLLTVIGANNPNPTPTKPPGVTPPPDTVITPKPSPTPTPTPVLPPPPPEHGIAKILVTVISKDVGTPGFYIHCLADNQPTGKAMSVRLFCYYDSPSVEPNQLGFPGEFGGGVPDAPPPPPYGDIDSKHTELNGLYNNGDGSVKLAGCFEDEDISDKFGYAYWEVVMFTQPGGIGSGTVDIWTNQDIDDCTAGAAFGSYSTVAGPPVGNFDDAAFFWEQLSTSKDYDSDGDGLPDAVELRDEDGGGSLSNCGGRDPFNPYDWYDVNQDGVIDLINDILGVIDRWQPNAGGAPPYDVIYDRPAIIVGATGNWNRGAPDGVIDLINDILGVIDQWHPNPC